MHTTGSTDRLITLGPNCAAVPESLLLAHSQGRVLFVTGAGTSAAASLPDFRQLVLGTYQTIDTAAHAVLSKVPSDNSLKGIKLGALNDKQRAELNQFCRNNYDVVLGMLERRIDGPGSSASTVRGRVAEVLRSAGAVPAPIHHALIKLAERGGAHTIATTNFDLLLEMAGQRQGQKIQSYSLGAIPRPTLRLSFGGILHIHGALDKKSDRIFDFIVSDEDFGEFYMRRRSVPDFIYDAARLFNIVLVGYSANDPPMRYLLSAVAADGTRFEDFKERFAFVGGKNPPDAIALEEWRGRGIVPIPYASTAGHLQLLQTLEEWAKLSAHRGGAEADKRIRKLVRTQRALATDADRDLYDHFIRRADVNERLRLIKVASAAGAELAWLDAALAVSKDATRRP